MTDKHDDPERMPVIVGVGQINDRPADPQAGLNSLELMVAALRIADADAGSGWLSSLDSLAIVDQISFRELNPVAPKLAEALGISPGHIEQTPMASGDSPILLLSEAANRIGAGDIKVAAIAGGEALRTAAHRAAQVQGTAISAQNASRAASTRRTPNYRQRYGLTAPVDVYPLYENAGRAAYGQTLAEGQRETAEIWSRFSDVANANAGAWIHKPASVAFIETVTADNRPIAFPYTKLMVANSSVNQGAAFIVTSFAEARRRGVSESNVIHVGNSAAAHEDDDPLRRDRYDRSVSMEVSIGRVLDLNEISVGDIDLVELYSCFPCVPKMARRILGWPIDKPATVFGGLTFGGGPIGNYMSHAVVSMVEKLRADGKFGLLFANGGLATHNHTIVLGREAIVGARFPRSFDYQAEADAKRDDIPPVTEDYFGPGTLETYTLFYERDGSIRHGVVVVRTPDGSRTLAKIPATDPVGLSLLSDGAIKSVGKKGAIGRGADGSQIWRHEI